MADAFRIFGLDPARIGEAAYPARGCSGTWRCTSSRARFSRRSGPVGVVEAIAGQTRLRCEFRGRAGHAGTLPMEGRRDALAAAAEFVLEIERLGRSVTDLRATVGALAVAPGAANVVPGLARLQHRHSPCEGRSPNCGRG